MNVHYARHEARNTGCRRQITQRSPIVTVPSSGAVSDSSTAGCHYAWRHLLLPPFADEDIICQVGVVRHQIVSG